MPRITKQHMKESIVSFANDAMRIINENFDFTERQELRIEHNGWYYWIQYLKQYNEIAIIRHNYRLNNDKDQPKGNRISERAFIYKEGDNCVLLRGNNGEIIREKDKGFLIDGFSVQDYLKKAF